MVHIPEYSLVIRPPEPIISYVASLKKQLRDEIGRFGSANAQAHLTVFNFDATPDELLTWKKNIQRFCEPIIPKEVLFDHFDSFPPRTFFVAPSNDSMIHLNSIITNFARFIGEKPQAHAHMSIARSLKDGQLEQVKCLFQNQSVHLEFLCDGLTLRKFDPATKQYAHIVERFHFAGKVLPDLFS
jgi:hypothetical protein